MAMLQSRSTPGPSGDPSTPGNTSPPGDGRTLNELLRRASEALYLGLIIAFPADTVWGLAVRACDPAAVRRLRSIKGRDASHPFPVYMSNIEAVRRHCRLDDGPAMLLAERFWPGPLTMVLEATGDSLEPVRAGDGTIGVRVPDSGLLRRLCLLAGPLAQTSANRTGRPTLQTAGQVAETFGDELAMVIDGTVSPGGLPSTVIRPHSRGFELLREGAVGAAELERLLQLASK